MNDAETSFSGDFEFGRCILDRIRMGLVCNGKPEASLSDYWSDRKVSRSWIGYVIWIRALDILIVI